jgi:hypothetical protein
MLKLIKENLSLISAIMGLMIVLFLITVLGIRIYQQFKAPKAIASQGGEVMTVNKPTVKLPEGDYLHPALPTWVILNAKVRYPYYLQRDEYWKATPIGNTTETIGAVGCTISSIASALTRFGYVFTPATINQRLTELKGYTENGYVIWGKVAELTNNKIAIAVVDPSYARLDQELKAEHPVIVKVMLGGLVQHWVLVVAKQDNEYLAIDPLNTRQELVKLSSLSDRIYALLIFQVK